MKKDSYPWIYDESISLFFLKKDARITDSGTDSTKIVNALCKKLEIVFGLDFIPNFTEKELNKFR